MKITELNTATHSLKNISVKFDRMSQTELSNLTEKLYRLGSKTQLDEQSLLAFFSISELNKLIKNWTLPTGRTELEAIAARQKIIWSGQNFHFDLTENPLIYAILNITPDSFFDGQAQNLDLSYILNKAEKALEQGAAVLELGGKSSRPGYSDITPAEEWQRLAQPLTELRKRFPQVPLAIDSDEAEVMRRALDAGADIINDIDGFDTTEKLEILRTYKPAVVPMNNGRAGLQYADDVFKELPQFFAHKIAELTDLGLAPEQICLDAGVGFWQGPSGSDSVQRIKSTELLTQFGLPVMIAISQKSFMTNVFGVPANERLFSTLMFEAQMMADGGRILRVHDVPETKQLLDAIKIYQNY